MKIAIIVEFNPEQIEVDEAEGKLEAICMDVLTSFIDPDDEGLVVNYEVKELK